jgi:SAM-dependent methyltransferase
MKIYRVVLSSAVTLVLLSLLLLPGNARAQEYVYQEDFEDGVAQDWTLDPGWQVIQDEGNYVLSGQGHTWARSGKLYDDYRLSFRLKILGGGGHLNFRINNTGRYFIGFDARGSQLGKQYWPDTFLHELILIANAYCAHQSWVEFRHGDAAKLPFLDGHFDVVVSTQVLEYLPDLQVALVELYRVLRPGGCAVILDTDWDSIVWNTADSVRMNHILAVWDEHVANFHLPKTLARNFCEAGFQIETQQIIPIFNPDFDPNTFSNRLIDLIIPF